MVHIQGVGFSSAGRCVCHQRRRRRWLAVAPGWVRHRRATPGCRARHGTGWPAWSWSSDPCSPRWGPSPAAGYGATAEPGKCMGVWNMFEPMLCLKLRWKNISVFLLNPDFSARNNSIKHNNTNGFKQAQLQLKTDLNTNFLIISYKCNAQPEVWIVTSP